MQTQNKKSKTATISRFLSAKRLSVVSCSRTRGFTLIELLITVAISTIMTGIVVSNYREYDTNAYFANASEDIVLALRQAQVYGAGGKANTAACVSGGTFSECRYGVYFSSKSGSSDGVTLFVDSNDNKAYDSGTDGILETVKWKNPIKISTLDCGGTSCAGGNLYTTFRRPNPDAWIADSPNSSTSWDTAKITITNGVTPSKSTTITISKAGQISIK